ncbi:MAG: beta-ketoacyl synthase N-terminal-like domain-containing protein, partial [Longimicrobiales bacterium]|nr:beta-ketoacyl synthase N-terminal-like domain-containing protein [Longimicrobiales bacterium]
MPSTGAPPYRVAITGIGPVTAVGSGKEAFLRGLRAARSPIRRATRFEPDQWRSHLAAEVDDFDPADFLDAQQVRRLDRFMHFAVATTRMALEDAGLEPGDVDRDGVAVQFGSALGGVAYAEEQVVNLVTRGKRAVDPRVALTTFGGAASCGVAIEFGFTGPNATNAMSCASGTIAIGEGFRLIRDGTSDMAV